MLSGGRIAKVSGRPAGIRASALSDADIAPLHAAT
jgi:hypothetical protein